MLHIHIMLCTKLSVILLFYFVNLFHKISLFPEVPNKITIKLLLDMGKMKGILSKLLIRIDEKLF